jgi:hypothetical protein
MAIIYDMLTGKIITEAAVTQRAQHPSAYRHVEPGLQTLHAAGNPQTQAACSAYMVLLQRVLKDL